MNRVPLTKALIERAMASPPPEGTTRYLWDSKAPGLGVRVHPSGSATFVLQTREQGKQRRVMLNAIHGAGALAHNWPGHGSLLDIARQQASERRQAGPAAAPVMLDKSISDEHSIEAVAAEFVKRHLQGLERSPHYIAASEAMLRRYVLPAWEGRDVREITRRDVNALLDGIRDAGKLITANRVLSLVSALFNWCLSRDLIEASPAVRVRKPSKEHTRERVLSDAELASVWHAAVALGERAGAYASIPYQGRPWGAWFRLLVLTGQRRSEVARMKWADVNIAEATWTLGAKQTKAGRAHVVPLSQAALDVLAGLPASGSPFVLTTRGSGPISNYDNGKSQLDGVLAGRVEKVAPFRIHDLRRTMATGMAKLEVAPHVIGAVLNHAPQGVTAQVYNKYSYGKEKREALELWAQHVLAVAEAHKPEPTAEEVRQAEFVRNLPEPTMRFAEAEAALVAALG